MIDTRKRTGRGAIARDDWENLARVILKNGHPEIVEKYRYRKGEHAAKIEKTTRAMKAEFENIRIAELK